MSSTRLAVRHAARRQRLGIPLSVATPAARTCATDGDVTHGDLMVVIPIGVQAADDRHQVPQCQEQPVMALTQPGYLLDLSIALPSVSPNPYGSNSLSLMLHSPVSHF